MPENAEQEGHFSQFEAVREKTEERRASSIGAGEGDALTVGKHPGYGGI